MTGLALEGSYSHGVADQAGSYPCGVADETMGYCNVDSEVGGVRSDGLPPHGTVSLDSPMFDVNADGVFDTQTAAFPLNAFSLSCKFAVAQDQYNYEDLSNEQTGSLQSLPAFSSLSLPSVPLLNVDTVQQQLCSPSSTLPRAGVRTRARQNVKALEMRAALNITRQRGGRNMNWVGGRRSPSPSLVSTPLPRVHPSQHVAPVRRGPGPHGAKTNNRTPGVKLGRPFGSTSSKKGNTQQKRVQVERGSFNQDDDVEIISEYDLQRSRNIAENLAFMRMIGIQDDVQTIWPIQSIKRREPRIQACVVPLNDVCVPGMYEQPCSGWVYDMKHSRYLKEAIKSQCHVLGRGVSALGVY